MNKTANKFTFVHKGNFNPLYTAERISEDRYIVSWEDTNGLGAGSTDYTEEMVRRIITEGTWLVREVIDAATTGTAWPFPATATALSFDDAGLSEHLFGSSVVESLNIDNYGEIEIDNLDEAGNDDYFEDAESLAIIAELMNEQQLTLADLRSFSLETGSIVTVEEEFYVVNSSYGEFVVSTVEQLVDTMNAIRVLDRAVDRG